MDQVEVTYDRAAMARYGINVADVNETIETAIAGKEATRVVDGQMRIATVVRFPAGAKTDIGGINGLLITAEGGVRISLGQLAIGPGPR